MFEVMVAILVLSVGMLSVAALAGAMITAGGRSRYVSLETTLASEKLEELNHWSPTAPQIAVPTGSTSVGDLSSDVLDSTSGIAYYDDVNIDFSNSGSDCPGSSDGCLAETVASQSGGTTQYTTTYHSPDGRIPPPTTSTTAPATLTFKRRWVIEANAPVAGVRRITVKVMPNTSTAQNSASFQMSTVRP
jgi:Tfp pilus assembly protein PilV